MDPPKPRGLPLHEISERRGVGRGAADKNLKRCTDPSQREEIGAQRQPLLPMRIPHPGWVRIILRARLSTVPIKSARTAFLVRSCATRPPREAHSQDRTPGQLQKKPTPARIPTMATERWWHSVAIGLLHLVLFGLAYGIGFIVEAFVSERCYPQSHLAAFAPCIAAVAFLTALLVNRTRKHRLPLLFGVVAVLYLAAAIWDEGRGWDYAWARIKGTIPAPHVLRHNATVQHERLHRGLVLHHALRRRRRLLPRSRRRPHDSREVASAQSFTKHALASARNRGRAQFTALPIKSRRASAFLVRSCAMRPP